MFESVKVPKKMVDSPINEAIFEEIEDDSVEHKVIEVPVVKKMVFQFKKPVKLKFS